MHFTKVLLAFKRSNTRKKPLEESGIVEFFFSGLRVPLLTAGYRSLLLLLIEKQMVDLNLLC